MIPLILISWLVIGAITWIVMIILQRKGVDFSIKDWIDATMAFISCLLGWPIVLLIIYPFFIHNYIKNKK